MTECEEKRLFAINFQSRVLRLTFLAVLLLLLVSPSAFALQQLLNTGFTGSAANWTIDNQIIRANAMTNWAYAGGTGNPAGSFYGRFLSGANNRQSDGIIQQTFVTPAGQVNASVIMERNKFRSANAIDYFRLYLRLLDSTSAAYPNETGFSLTVDDLTGTYAIPGTWESTGWTTPYLLDANQTYIVRVYMDVRVDNGRNSGAYIDNVMCNISPYGLTASLNGTANDLSWAASTGAAALHGATPYRIYRSITSGSYGAALDTSIAPSYTDPAPPAAAIVYYVITDVDSTGLESPASVELPVIRNAVRDGSGADVDNIVGTDIAMNWDNVVIAKLRYEVALGTTPGGADIVGWTDAALATSYTFVGAPVTNGTTYYTSVRIVTAERTLNSCFSDGFVAINMDVRDGNGADIDFSGSLSDADMNWEALIVPVDHYEAALGTTVGGSDIVGWTNVNLATSHGFTGLSLSNGTTYYCSVKAFDPTLTEIAVFSSDGFAPAVSPDIIVRDGTGADIDYTFSQNAINVNWDDLAGFPKLRYEAALGTAPGSSDITAWADMGLGTSGLLSGFSLATSTTYYCSVRIVHDLGTLPPSSSDGFVYYRLGVRDSLGADIDNSFLPDTLQGNWDSSPVPFLRYEAAAGTTPGGTDIVGWTDMGTSTSASFPGLPLVSGTMYYFSVRIIDMGGIPMDTVFSDGVLTTVVTDITVRDGLWPDIEHSFFEDRAEMNWDHPAAGIVRYEVALGTSQFGTEISPFNDVGHANQFAITGLSLASGTRYFATVRGINSFGAVEAFGSSDGFVARRDQVLVDTAAQTYFNNARVMRMIDSTTIPGSIQPKLFSAGGGAAAYWGRWVPVAVTEPGVTSRINAPCRIQLAGLTGVAANAIRVADESGNEIPRWLLASTATTMDLVFLVNMAQGETKTYYVYWENGTAVNPGAYGFTNTATDISTNQWTPYYSRKNMPPGIEDVALGAPLSNADDVTVSPGNVPWAFYFFGTDTRGWRINTNGFLCTNAAAGATQYQNRWAQFAGTAAYFGRVITPMWSDLWPGGGSPQNDGIYRNVFGDRVVYTWRANRFGVRDDIYITQATLYQSSDIALSYSYLSPLGIIGPAGAYDRPENTENTVGISMANNTMWLRNTPLVIGIGKSPTVFYQCADAFRGNYVAGAPVGGGAGTWAEIAHIESMVFDSRTANPIWQRIEYDCSGNANNRLVISTRSGSTPLPEMGGWTGWVAAATVTANGNTPLTSTDRYIQYRVGFERNGTIGALAVLNEIRFVHGGISIEEVKANTPDGVTQGQTGIPVEVTIRNFYTNPVDLVSIQLTFTLGDYTHILTAPVVPGTQIPAGATISASFTVDVDINSPVGTATVDAIATATSGGYTFQDYDAQVTHEWRVKSRANLDILKVETEPAFVNKGQTDIYVTMLIANIGETPYYFAGATLTFSLGEYLPPPVLQSPPIGTEIPPLSEFLATFTVNISPTSDSGFVAVIGGTASGTDTFSGLITDDATADITDSWTIQNPASLVLEEVTASSTVYRGQANAPVFLRVSNNGESTAVWESSELLTYFTLGTYDSIYAVTPFDITIPGYFEATARYGVDISPTSATGTTPVDAGIYGSDTNTGNALNWVTGALLPATWTIMAEKANTFKDPAYAFPSASFNRPTAGNVTVYARGENVNPYAEYVFRWIDPLGSTLLVSAPLTADASGTMYHQFDITPLSDYGTYKVRITNPTNTVISVENVFEVTSPAILSGMFELPSLVSVGQPFVGSMTFINTGGADIESGYVSTLELFTPALANVNSGPIPAVINVTGNSQATATYQFTALAPGNFSASATIYGFDANDGTLLTSPAFTSNICVIQTPPSLTTISVTTVPTIVYLNQKNLRIDVVIRNSGQATAILDAASMTFTVGGYDQTILSPALPYELAGNNTEVTITYDISVDPDSPVGLATFTSNVLWHDKNWPESGGYLTGPPRDSWAINPIGIWLAANLTYEPLQDDFNRSQTIYIRCYGFAPLAQWYRVRLYNYEVPQAGNSPAGWINCSPQLSADDDGYIDHLYTIMPADTIGTWTVIIDTGTGAAGGPKQSLQYFRVQNIGNLVASLTISPTEVFVGENFTVTMLASNTIVSGSTISNASPAALVPASAFPNFAGSATLLSGPAPASATIKAGETKQFVWTYRADTNSGMVGSYSLTVNPAYYAAGNDLNSQALISSNKAVSSPLRIYSRDFGLSSDTLDFATMDCGVSKMLGTTQVVNLGNYPLDQIKWITSDLNGPVALKISKANLSMSPLLIEGIAAGSYKNASATLFVPYNKEAGDYIATMSVYQDLNDNSLFDLGELYDFFAVKVTVPPCRKVFAVQDLVDLGSWDVGKDTLPQPLNVFSGGNIALDNVRFMQLPGATSTFAINVNPAVYGPLAMTGSFIASVTALNVVTDGVYIATWTAWDDWHNVGAVDVDEASDTFQVRIRVGTVDFTLLPALVDGGTIEPSEVKNGFGLTLTNVGTLPLEKLKFDPQPLINATFDEIATDSIAIDGVLPGLINPGANAPINFIIFAPAGMEVGTYTALQYFYHDDDLDGVWDADEFRASFTLRVEVLPMAKVQVLTPTIGMGGISPGTSKIVSFNCRNTGNVTLTGLRWEKVNLAFGANTIPAANASFPPSELFSVAAGDFFTRNIEVTVPGGQAYGVYNSVPGHFWLFADMSPVDALRSPGEAESNFSINCEVGEMKVVIENPPLLSSNGNPSALSSLVTFDVRNTGSLNLANLKATASVLIPTIVGPATIVATASVLSPANIGSLNIGQLKQSTWRVNTPANASAATYIGTLTVWEDANSNGINENAEASATVPVELIVNSTRAIDVTAPLLDLGYVGKNNSRSGNFEIRNVGNIDLTNILSLKAPLIFGANNIPVGSITFTLPATSLLIGTSMVATVTVTIGPVQGSYTYNGTQAVYEDHSAPLGSWNAGEASDTFVLRVSVGEKGLYETAVGNPALNFGARNVNASYSIPVTVYNNTLVPLPRVRWQMLSPLTGSDYTFPVASLSFAPANAQSIGAAPANYPWAANLSIGQSTPAGNYIATAVFYDDDNVNSTFEAAEASATFNVLLNVNATHSIMIVDSILLTKLNIVDFGAVDQGQAKAVEVTFKNTGNVELSNFSWDFGNVHHASEPVFINSAQFSYDLPAPVAPNTYGTITVTLTVPAGQTIGDYGPSGAQTLYAALPAPASDSCDFQCEVTSAGDVFEMAEGSVFQSVATTTFATLAPDNLYFLSAWVCPGSGSADIALIQYDKDREAVATAAIRLTPDGLLVTTDSAPAFEIKHSGITNKIPMNIDGESFHYFRIYLAFDLTFDTAAASYTAIILQNSSAVSPRSVWFDGIQLEKAIPGQTRPVAYHDRAIIHSPNKLRTLDGRYHYYER